MTISAELATIEPPVAPQKSLHPRAAMAFGAAAAAALLATAFHGVDTGRVAALVRSVGALSGLLLVPSLAAVTLETYAWQAGLAVSGVEARFAGLFAVRVVSESVGSVLPLGPVWADAMKPPLLQQRCGVPLAAGIAAIAVRKYLLVLSQAGYLLTAFLVGGAALREVLARRTGLPLLSLAPLVAACALAAVGLSTRALLRGGNALRRAFAALSRIRVAPVRAWLLRVQTAARGVDGATAAFFAAPFRAHLRPLAVCFVAWLLESVETWLVLRALGAHLAWGEVAGVEALVALSRHLLPIVPGGIGVQELGYGMLLAGLGCDGERALSLALMKRLRELFWLAAGATELARSGLLRERMRAAAP